jgi:hypothetical protein
VKRLVPGCRDPDHLKRLVRLERHPQSLREAAVVVCDQDASAARWRRRLRRHAPESDRRLLPFKLPERKVLGSHYVVRSAGATPCRWAQRLASVRFVTFSFW